MDCRLQGNPTAHFSRCGLFRYRLTRRWADGPPLLWIMLNPSTADAHRNDPTIVRVEARTRQWGWPGLVVCNLFALRATRPEALRQAADPVGPRTDRILRREVRGAGAILCAWGVHGALGKRDAEVRAMLAGRDPLCLGLTKDGHPRHPLYLRADREPEPFRHGPLRSGRPRRAEAG